MEKHKIKSYIKQIRGVSYKPDDLFDVLDNSSVILLRANNIEDGIINFDSIQYVSKSKVSSEQYLKKGDILICASSGSKSLVGKAASFDFDIECTFGAFCKVIRPKDGYSQYLSVFFQSQSYRQKISEFAIGANINNIRNEHIDELYISMYPESERCFIVKKVNTVQSIIYWRKYMIKKLDELIKARFVELFGNPAINDKEWKVCRLGDECKVINGRAYKTEELLDKGKYQVLRVGNFFTNNNWYYSDLELEKDKYCEDGDLLFAWSASFGPRIWHGKKVIYHYHIWKLTGYENCLNKNFFVELLNYNCEAMKADTHGSTMLHFTKAQMEEQQLILPPIAIQEQFATFVDQVNKSKFTGYFTTSNPYIQNPNFAVKWS